MLEANMHVFAPEVLGVQVLFNARVNWDRIPPRSERFTSLLDHTPCSAVKRFLQRGQ